MDYNGFYTGKTFDAYKYLGCHLEGDKAVFRVFAPAAKRVCFIAECNGWTESDMGRVYNGQFWEIEVPEVKEGMQYKYRIYGCDGRCIDHADPYGYGMELRPQNASIVRDLHSYKFQDEKWMKKRTDCKDKPLNIYEMHIGSWMENKEDENGWFTYDKVAKKLIPYLKEYGYNYVEIMPISEHPCDNSWGYQCSGFYSPTSRYGTMNDLKCFIDNCHQNDIGVILDFVPVHFAVDDYALADFDGTQLYEYPNSDVGESEWGSKNFNHSRGEVQSFLQSNACYWLEEYHFDGLRMDAINNIIYWQGNSQRGVNVNATEFVKNMNRHIKSAYPAVILAAEDSSSYAKVTKPVEEGGLGFDYKWDMGWMNDTLEYFRTGAEYRSRDYHKLTFSMMYYYDEKFLLPFSHDEVVHGKATITQKMNGDYEDKFPQARALYMYMMTHPGKKLNFMGNELAMFREWDEKRELDWDILEYPLHSAFHNYMKDLNHCYLEYPALFEADYVQSGFQWLDCHQENRVVYIYQRSAGEQTIVVVLNLSAQEQKDIEIKSEEGKQLELVLSTDMARYGGNAQERKGEKLKFENGRAMVDMPPYSGKMYLLK